jgi:hypothetical protein
MSNRVTLFGIGTLALALAVMAPSSAFAGICTWFPSLCGGTIPSTPQAPEIDPGTLSATFSLLAGGVLMLVERRRRR